MDDGEVASTVNEVLFQSSLSVTEIDAWSPDKSLSIDRSAGLSRKLAVPKVMLSLGLSIMGSRSTFLGAENLPRVLFSVETRFLVAVDELNGFRGSELGREGEGVVMVPSGSSEGALVACEGEKLDRNADGEEDANGFELKDVFDGGGGIANYSIEGSNVSMSISRKRCMLPRHANDTPPLHSRRQPGWHQDHKCRVSMVAIPNKEINKIKK